MCKIPDGYYHMVSHHEELKMSISIKQTYYLLDTLTPLSQKVFKVGLCIFHLCISKSPAECQLHSRGSIKFGN